MKVLAKVFSLALVLAGAGLISSCSSEDANEPNVNNKDGKISLIKAPEIAVYSGSENLYGTRAEADEEVAPYVVPNEVEVNLAINDSHVYDGEDLNDLVSKLSIHIRNANDVEITIPVPLQYIVEVDDMDIVLSHQYLDEQWKGEGSSVTYEFAEIDKSVTIEVAYSEAGIVITTSGMCQEILDYVGELYGDGVNFEVWNYFNNEYTREALRADLNNATIKFIGGIPETYVNAFVLESTDEECVDHTVSIVEDQRSEFEAETTTGRHNNVVYTKVAAEETEPLPAE